MRPTETGIPMDMALNASLENFAWAVCRNVLALALALAHAPVVVRATRLPARLSTSHSASAPRMNSANCSCRTAGGPVAQTCAPPWGHSLLLRPDRHPWTCSLVMTVVPQVHRSPLAPLAEIEAMLAAVFRIHRGEPSSSGASRCLQGQYCRRIATVTPSATAHKRRKWIAERRRAPLLSTTTKRPTWGREVTGIERRAVACLCLCLPVWWW